MSPLGRVTIVMAGLALACPSGCTFPDYDFGADASGGSAGISGGGGEGAVTGGSGGASPDGGSSGAPPLPTCDDGVKNGDETDADCGGPECMPCQNAQGCREDTDCASGRCDPIDRQCRPGLVVRCHCTENCSAGLQAVSKMAFWIANRAAEALPLEGTVLRYYYTQENAADHALCTASGLPGGCDAIRQEQRPLVPPGMGATHVFELQFTSDNGSVPPNGTTPITGFELRAPGGQNVNQLDDYSFYDTGITPAPVLDCDRITLHRITEEFGAVLIWGTPPPPQ